MPYKLGSDVANSILLKMLQHKSSLNVLERQGKFASWFHDGPTYWIRALPFEPNVAMRSERSNHYHAVPTSTKRDALVIASVLSSSVFYFFFKAMSNCRDFGDKEFNEFPMLLPGAVSSLHFRLLRTEHVLPESIA
jgi:hypothetical protein